MSASPAPWWQQAVVYQIYPRSFLDTNGDGVGDLEGIRRKLDHLEWLGVDAIWLSPFFKSPMKDFGYDVADYCDVDPLFGNMDDFDRLLNDAHSRGIKVMIDWVPNHSSDQHPWFQESKASRDNAKADWYIWHDADPDDPTRPPNNWRCAFTNGPAWDWCDERQQWYLHLFLPEQPDLNWRNPEVVEAMHGTLRFWLDNGVDGFRMDVIHGILKQPGFPDMPEGSDAHFTPEVRYDIEGTIDAVRDLRRLLDSYPGDRAMVGEVYILSTERVAEFYGQNDALHMAFNFPPLYAPWNAEKWRKRIDRVVEELDPKDAWPTWVLSNHDNPRHRTRYGSEARARAAAVLLLTLRGTPFLYAGEELGLEDAVIPSDRVVDPGGRDGCRAPIPWTSESDHGWGQDDNWLPWPANADTHNAEVARHDDGSVLHLYQRILAARRGSAALRLGSFEYLDAPEGVLAYVRASGDDRRLVLVNFTDDEIACEVADSWRVEVSSVRGPDGAGYEGTLGANEAVILHP
ncbi:MAG TPA: alpha-amylase family glycosyl hydrolase [Acidimicrobiales bacterium]|nr:alpha-amylase family glycosyl hydrolase [Acidimicrobiales bacterium]